MPAMAAFICTKGRALWALSLQGVGYEMIPLAYWHGSHEQGNLYVAFGVEKEILTWVQWGSTGV